MGCGFSNMGVKMKTLLIVISFILVCTGIANAANPDYKSFKGIGGIIIVSNPPQGDITIDGSGISAGALPDYAVTNNDTRTINLLGTVTFTTRMTSTVAQAGSVVAGQYTNTSLPTNAFMRIGPGGIMTTGVIGSGVSLSAGGTLSSYFMVSSNGGSLSAVTQLVARSGIVVSNDAVGTVSFHVPTSELSSQAITNNETRNINLIGTVTNQDVQITGILASQATGPGSGLRISASSHFSTVVVTNSITNQGWITMGGILTNKGAAIYVEDPDSPGFPNILLYGDDAGPAIVTYRNALTVGVTGRALVIESNENRVAWANEPYGNIGLGTFYGVDQVAASNFLAARTIRIGGITADRMLSINAQGDVTNAPFKLDLLSPTAGQSLVFHSATVVTNATVSGGSASAVGGDNAVQYATNTADFGGSSIFTYNPITRQLKTISVDTAPTNGISFRNAFDSDGIKYDGEGMVSDTSISIGVNGHSHLTAPDWVFQNDGVFQPGTANISPLLGSAGAGRQVHGHFTVVSNRTLTPIAGVIYGTNQSYSTNLTATAPTLTFSDSGLLTGVPYFVRGTNGTSVVSYAASWISRTGKDTTTFPSYQNTAFEFKVIVDANGTNFYEVHSQLLELAAGTGGPSLRTNSGVVYIDHAFNSLPQFPTNYPLTYDRRMVWGSYFPNGSAAPVGSGIFGTPSTVASSFLADSPPSVTNSHYGIVKAIGSPIEARIGQQSGGAGFVVTNTTFHFTSTVGFSNAPGTNLMRVDIYDISVGSMNNPYANCGWFAQTAGSTGTNWTATYRSNNTATIVIYTATERTDQWHTLGIGNPSGSAIVWYMDGVPVATNSTAGMISTGGVGGQPIIGQRVSLSPNGTNFMFWQGMELVRELVTPVKTGPL